MLAYRMSRRSHPPHPLAIKQLEAGLFFSESGLGLSLAQSLRGKINSMRSLDGDLLDGFNHIVAATGRGPAKALRLGACRVSALHRVVALIT